jgi:hypothetical protein
MNSTDYAAMPESGAAESKEERNAELVLAKLADRLVMSGRAPVLIVMSVYQVSLVFTGLWLRTYFAPRGWQAAAGCAALVTVALAAPALARRAGNKEPPWARAAATHEQSVRERLPEDTRAMLRDFTASMTAGTRWQGGAHVYVSRCTEEEEDRVHYAACCAGGTLVMHGRLLVILGDHLAMGPATLAKAVLAHERRHISGWRLHAYALASVAGTYGLVIAGWTVTPWPALLLAAASIHAARTATLWLVEISCDVGSARETSTDAMLATIDFKQRTEGGAHALQPRGKRRARSILACLAGLEHPPYRVRRAAIRALT